MEWLIVGGFFIFSFIVLIIVFYSTAKKNERETIINYAFYKAVFDSFLDRSYELIHKDRLFIYSLEATRVSDSEFNEITKQFILLVEKMMGPYLYNIYIELYGNRETLMFNIAEYFNSRYENDEVRKTAVENMMEQEVTSNNEDMQNVAGQIPT